MSASNEVDMSKSTRSFPEEGKFPSAADYRDYVVRSLAELDVSSYWLSRQIPGNTNNNFVREIETGARTNPTLRKMRQIFEVIEGVRAAQLKDPVVVEPAE